MPLLVRTPAPHPTESLYGYVLRLAEVNGYHSPGLVLNIADSPLASYESNLGPSIAHIASILGRPVEDLRSVTHEWPIGSGRFVLLEEPMGDWVRKGGLTPKSPKVCVACVKENGYIDAFWDLAIAAACPVHRVEPVRSCRACGKPLTWRRCGLLTCACGAALDESEQTQADEVTVELMRLVYAKLHGTSLDTHDNRFSFPTEWMKAASVSSVLQAVRVIGAAAIGAESFVDPRIPFAAAHALCNWPNAYHEFLRGYATRNIDRNPNLAGISAQFSPLYWALFRSEVGNSDLSVFRREFLEFTANKWPHAVLDRRTLSARETHEVPRFISQAEFMRRYRIVKPVMKRLIAERALVAVPTRCGARTRVLIDVSKSKMPVVDQARPLRWKFVAKRLGLPMKVAEVLRERGVLPTKLRSGNTATWYVEDIDAFVNVAMRLASVPSDSKRAVTLSKALRMRVGSPQAKADVVTSVLTGEVSVLGRIGPTIGDLQIDRDLAVAKVVQKRSERGLSTCSLPEAARRTGLTYDVMHAAIKAGLLVARREKGKTVVTAKSIAAFSDRYVVLRALARQLNTSGGNLKRIAARQGIDLILVRRKYDPAPLGIIKLADKARLMEGYGEFALGQRTPTQIVFDQLRSLRKYLTGLEERGELLPRRAGKPMKAAIAKACGFGRMVLYDVPEAVVLLAEFDRREQARLGLVPDPEDRLRAYVDGFCAEGGSLPVWGEKPNLAKIAEACGLDRNLFYRKRGRLRIPAPTQTRRPRRTSREKKRRFT